MHGLQLLHHVNARVNECLGRSDWRLIGWPPSVSFSSSLASSQFFAIFAWFGLLSALRQHQHHTERPIFSVMQFMGGSFSFVFVIYSRRIATINLLQNNISITHSRYSALGSCHTQQRSTLRRPTNVVHRPFYPVPPLQSLQQAHL